MIQASVSLPIWWSKAFECHNYQTATHTLNWWSQTWQVLAVVLVIARTDLHTTSRHS